MANFVSHSIARGGRTGEVPVPRLRKKIVFLLFPGFRLPEIATVLEVFQAANRNSAPYGAGGTTPLYDVQLKSLEGGRLESSSAVSIWTEPLAQTRAVEPIDALFIAGPGTSALSGNEAQLERIRYVSSQAANLIPMADSKALLTIAGVSGQPGYMPAGKNAEDGSARRSAHAFIELFDGPVQRALHIIRQDHGPTIPRAITDVTLPGRQEVGLMSAVRERASKSATERILESARWIEQNGGNSVSIADAAQIAAMSERNFLRRFKIEIGVTPSEYLMYSRLELCCQLLVETDLPVEKIARRCGLSGGGSLSKLFRKQFALTPTEYRERRNIN